MREFDKISMQFHFKLTKNDKEPKILIFAKQEHIIALDFYTE